MLPIPLTPSYGKKMESEGINGGRRPAYLKLEILVDGLGQTQKSKQHGRSRNCGRPNIEVDNALAMPDTIGTGGLDGPLLPSDYSTPN